MRRRNDVGVIFDMDGVLVDSAEPHYQSWRLLAEECGSTVTRDQFSSTFGRHNGDIIPAIFGESSKEIIAELADRKEQLYRDLIRDKPPLVEGALQLIRALDDAGVPMAVGSSGPLRNIELILDALGARESIGVVVSGDDVSRGKPDPQVFRMACERLELAPSLCVVVEDAPVGVEAGRAAGARTVAVLKYHPTEAFVAPDLIVPRLLDLTVDALIALVQRHV